MSKEKSKYRVGLDDRPLTREEFVRVQAGEPLYCRIVAPSSHFRKKVLTRRSKGTSKKPSESFELI